VPFTPTQKVRRWRARQREGRRVLHVDVDMAATVEWMIDSGFLQPTDTIDDTATVAQAVGRAIAVWSRR
jgi:hypothetical protein